MVDVAGVVVDFATTQTLLRGDGGVEGETGRADEIKSVVVVGSMNQVGVSGCFGSDWTIIHPRLFPLLVTAYHPSRHVYPRYRLSPSHIQHMHLPRVNAKATSPR